MAIPTSRAAMALLRTGSGVPMGPLECRFCQWQRAAYSSAATSKPSPTPTSISGDAGAAAKPPSTEVPEIEAPRSYGRKTYKFTPKPLPRPIGVPSRPQPGDNSAIDMRTFKQRRADLVNHEKHLERRRALTQKWLRPYFRDWTNLQHQDGKSWIAPPRLFKADKSLYFPNLIGQTLQKDGLERDTTPVLEGKASIVCIFRAHWGEEQVGTFISEKSNPAVQQVIKENPDVAQIVRINVEDNWMKAMLVQMFKGSLRKTHGEANWGRYFLVTRGLPDNIDLREHIGLLNMSVGYTYLVDNECRIRWAGSANAQDEEKEGLAKGFQKLVNEAKEAAGTASSPVSEQGLKSRVEKQVTAV